jgi:hypothetical protein
MVLSKPVQRARGSCDGCSLVTERLHEHEGSHLCRRCLDRVRGQKKRDEQRRH